MLELQENITKIQSSTAAVRRNLIKEATREYFDALDPIGSPAPGDFEAAGDRAYAILRHRLLTPSAVALMNGGTELDDDAMALLTLSFDTIARPLRRPAPLLRAETRSVGLGLSAAVGAVVGMLVLAPAMRLAFEMRDLGLVLGGPLGALLFVLLMHQLARLRFLTRLLPWLFVRPKALRGAARNDHEKAVGTVISQWVDGAVPILAVLCFHRSGPPEAKTDKDKALRRLGKLIYTLQQAPPESLPVVAHELIQEAKNSGFEGLEGLPAFLEARHESDETLVWKEELRTRYESFGHIAEGDQVTVERPPVVFGGKIVQRGLVRRIRDRA